MRSKKDRAGGHSFVTLDYNCRNERAPIRPGYLIPKLLLDFSVVVRFGVR